MNIFKATLLSGLLAIAATPAFAATTSNTLGVKVTVTGVCVLNTNTDVDFGTVASNSGPVSATGAINVKCTKGTTYNMGLDKGANGASVTSRAMKGAVDTLPYNLYLDSGHTKTWGTTIGTDTYAGTGAAGSAQSIPVYGVLPAADVTAGAYTDTVTVTVTY